ncbi:hypothetical protein FHR81_000451 [Actinoalloteichus hoggarensis]|uniref:Uncharacterized protein n=1 Tax=Actinoalloteichus hoggarensis TaxID=1470176 RepID=A0A221W2F3_9PSEU|nr:hypothetical protein [Actinoalloteichus hoggarensis]ASO19869.1 hypothetical protein AHOG_11130 [Actinoalloteichus hoggarensis]MBB5919422.1 hypothetical protein [Actinoalloteichus hoggarensis]
MSHRNTVVRAVHDLGLAVWFGGSLMGAVGLTGASEESSSAAERSRIAAAGWRSWSPVSAAAIGAHLIGGLALTKANRERIRQQNGVAAASIAKTVLTGAALAATVYARRLVRTLDSMTDQPAPARGAGDHVDPELITLQQRLRAVQWAVPVLTGAIEVLSALQGEQQRSFRHEADGRDSERHAGGRRRTTGRAPHQHERSEHRQRPSTGRPHPRSPARRHHHRHGPSAAHHHGRFHLGRRDHGG